MHSPAWTEPPRQDVDRSFANGPLSKKQLVVAAVPMLSEEALQTAHLLFFGDCVCSIVNGWADSGEYPPE